MISKIRNSIGMAFVLVGIFFLTKKGKVELLMFIVRVLDDAKGKVS